MAVLKNRVRQKLEERYGEDMPSQAVIAEQLGLSQTTVSRWMSNKIDRFDADVLGKWCKFFNCQIGDILYFEEIA